MLQLAITVNYSSNKNKIGKFCSILEVHGIFHDYVSVLAHEVPSKIQNS